MGWAETRVRELAATLETLDDELTDQKVELTLHGAAIKQLLEDRTRDREDRARDREHSWQLKLLAATIVITNLATLISNLLLQHH